MAFNRTDLADLAAFLAIARHRNFRQAGLALGVSASALSHALKGLEERMGVRLVNRTNRSVTLSAAGEDLQAALEEPFAAVLGAEDVLNRYRDVPRGRIRINVPDVAAQWLLAPVLPEFNRRWPDIELDISVDNRLLDVFDDGFDAGIRFGGTVPDDMIAQRLSADVEWVVAASPSYLAEHGVPEHPHDLARHRCLQVRLGDDRIYRWEFERGGEVITLAVPGSITHNSGGLAISLALGGAGLVYTAKASVADDLAAGRLQSVLEDWIASGPALHLYYPGRRHLPLGLRLLVDLIREKRPLGF
ncbi:LysR family transcriptional regulator [Novosphingobium umbonatum]|uniref:LysR family transcriptional regulator n=1 Tax=Novosphingobium umbonatum TaxID=1908524 RepID=A0A3S2UT13_9SPHN|nr:LysR family transcriptional regulator [Novosphingobium umbonatum]RVU04142.1 LysR family transcriptional regulator [Novosphingobium umbonatum]